MTDPMQQPLDRLTQALNRAPIIAPEILMPGLVLTVLWPILRVVYDSEVDAFLLAFLVTFSPGLQQQ